MAFVVEFNQLWRPAKPSCRICGTVHDPSVGSCGRAEALVDWFLERKGVQATLAQIHLLVPVFTISMFTDSKLVAVGYGFTISVIMVIGTIWAHRVVSNAWRGPKDTLSDV